MIDFVFIKSIEKIAVMHFPPIFNKILLKFPILWVWAMFSKYSHKKNPCIGEKYKSMVKTVLTFFYRVINSKIYARKQWLAYQMFVVLLVCACNNAQRGTRGLISTSNAGRFAVLVQCKTQPKETVILLC